MPMNPSFQFCVLAWCCFLLGVAVTISTISTIEGIGAAAATVGALTIAVVKTITYRTLP